MLCKKEPTDIVTLTSFKASARRRPDIQNLAKGHNAIFSAKDGSMTFCVYQRTITVPEESRDIMYDLSVPRHLLIAAGETNENGQIRYHGQDRFPTPNPIDVMRFRVRKYQSENEKYQFHSSEYYSEYLSSCHKTSNKKRLFNVHIALDER